MGALGLGLDAAAPPPYRSAMSSPSPRAAWPALPYRDWEPTKQTLHRYCQIVGKCAWRSCRLAITGGTSPCT